ncbi:MAG: hydrogenase formation protein HypD [Phycisphaerales bacterium JB039]
MTVRQKMDTLRRELDALAAELGRPACFMEVCGTHTVNACRSGVHALMPEQVNLVSGPGCPVCVTAQRYIDALVTLGGRPEVTLATYGDMLRVTGAGGSLELARSRGADVRVVTSTMEAIEIARAEPSRQVVLAAVGFETTTPATAAAVLKARDLELENFSVLTCHKLVIPAMEALIADPSIRIDGFLCPGHVSVIIGARAYEPIAQRGMPCVIAGFEALQIMEGIVRLTGQMVRGESRLENLYPSVVSDDGNRRAQQLIERVFEPSPSVWRALGVIDGSGLALREEFASLDAYRRFDIRLGADQEPAGCRCGEVITGRAKPHECRLFGTICTPMNPIGPCMVSSEGSCQAWFKYRRNEHKRPPAGAAV